MHSHISDWGGDPSRITLVGHSAGGHLTAMLARCDWSAVDAKLPKDLVKSALAISGSIRFSTVAASADSCKGICAWTRRRFYARVPLTSQRRDVAMVPRNSTASWVVTKVMNSYGKTSCFSSVGALRRYHQRSVFLARTTSPFWMSSSKPVAHSIGLLWV